MMPGMKAAMNSLAMFVSVRMAYTTSGTEGGMRMPSVPPTAIVAVVNRPE